MKKPRALYISYNGLLEEIVPSQVIPYVRELAKKGHSFVLLTFEKKDKLQAAGRQSLSDLKNKLEGMGIEWHWLRYHKKCPLMATSFDVAVGAIFSSYLVIRKGIKIVHARSIVPAAMSLVPKLFGAKFIFDTRGLLAEEYVGAGHWKEDGLKYNLVKFFERLCLKAADAIIVLTERHRLYLSELLFSGNKNDIIEKIPCCVDLNRFKYGFNRAPVNDFTFLYLGKIGKHYMLKEMLDFFKAALKLALGYNFVILTPNEKIDVVDVILKNGLDMSRITVKRPAFEEIPLLVSTADAGLFFINPYKKFGSSPIKLGEFLSCGVPVIINSGIGDTEEFVRTNKIGVVVDKFNEDEYKSALERLLFLMKDGEELNKRCRRAAEEHLSLEMGVDRYNRIYDRLLKCTV